MESVLSFDDGRWLRPAEQLCHTLIDDARENPMQLVGIRQPSPPPVLAKVHQEFVQIPPSKVADPRPGPAKTSQNACKFDGGLLEIMLPEAVAIVMAPTDEPSPHGIFHLSDPPVVCQ